MKKIQLTKEHLGRMRLPKRFWKVSFGDILPDSSEHKKIIKNYLSTIKDRFNDGCGLFLWGNNGTGKTSCAAVVAKEARRQGYLVLFVRSTSLRDGIINGEMFDDSNTLYDRMRSVDLLIIDDLGKEYSKEMGSYNEKMYEDLLRLRLDELKSTIITTNMNFGKLKEKYKESMIKLMKGYYVPVEVKGHDYIADARKRVCGPVMKG